MNTLLRTCLPLALACSALPPSQSCSSSATAPGPAVPTVRVESGLVSGLAGNDPAVLVFKGIPFAAPPTGARRWLPPEPPLPWSGVRSGAAFQKSCVQGLRRSYLPWTEAYMLRNDVDEDCLALNVWAPADAVGASGAARPVLVFIHGGAFNSGSGEVLLYDGEALAKKGIIVVTINYRLGVFGFFSHPALSEASPHHSSGNYGLLDQIAALGWVQRNIAAFGGSAANVTVAGQSAGAAAVHYLSASPLARGLFQRAIAESGAWDRRTETPTRAEAEAHGTEFAAGLGLDLAGLRALPAAALFESQQRAPVPFRPVVDGWVVPDQLAALMARGLFADVPLLTGLNADERSHQSDYGHTTLRDWSKSVRAEYGDSAAALLALYPAASDGEAGERQKELWRDAGLATLLDWRRARAQHGKSKDFGYLFERAIPWPEHPEYQVFHSAELPYVFDNLKHLDRPWTAVDRTLAEQMSNYWVNFIQHGDPNGPGLPHWPSEVEQVLRLGSEVRASLGLDAAHAVPLLARLAQPAK